MTKSSTPVGSVFTRVVHAGTHPEPVTGAIMTPIFQTSTYVQEEPAKHKGYDYSRADNPTREAYEEALSVLEGATQRAFGAL